MDNTSRAVFISLSRSSSFRGRADKNNVKSKATVLPYWKKILNDKCACQGWPTLGGIVELLFKLAFVVSISLMYQNFFVGRNTIWLDSNRYFPNKWHCLYPNMKLIRKHMNRESQSVPLESVNWLHRNSNNLLLYFC